MRYTLLVCLLVGCGLTDDPDMRELKSSLRVTGEEVAAKQDTAITILKDHTTALTAIKSQVDGLVVSTTETRAKLEALVVKSEAPKAEEEVIKSALEPQEATRPNPSQSSQPVALSPVVRSYGPLKMSWNVEGNWQPTILETAKHLREDHGIIADGMTHQQMHDVHAAAHEGRKVANKSQPVRLINRGTSCPGGVCPTPRRGLFGRLR